MATKKKYRIFFNKYIVALLFFFIWMMFFDQNRWPRQIERNQQLEEVTENIAYLNQKIQTLEREYHAIRTDDRALEQVAREKYRMKKEDEDLYIIR